MQIQTLIATTVLMIIAASVQAKEGIQATVHSKIKSAAIDGQRLELIWSLEDEKTAKPFTACSVFIRLISATDQSTEAFANGCVPDAQGHYRATVTVPEGSIANVEIGIAGTMTRDGKSSRSDWLIPLANDPLSH